MKRIVRYSCLILLVSMGLCSCRQDVPRQASLIGMTKSDLSKELGEPNQIVDATHEYPDQGLSVIIHDEKVLQYVIKRGSDLQTDLGVKIGMPISEVNKLYGDYKTEEEVEKWFTGDAPHVLYHHGEYDKYKINYPDKNLIFMFDEKKRVESIWFGFPLPKEK